MLLADSLLHVDNEKSETNYSKVNIVWLIVKAVSTLFSAVSKLQLALEEFNEKINVCRKAL